MVSTRQLKTERSNQGDTCGPVVYQRQSPAIIALVQRDDRILLARSPGGPPGMFGFIAGFVEYGENLEHALVREEKEETDISVKNIRHGASEPCPFPDSLMMGFTADFTGGELVVDGSELESAFWFDRPHLPRIPEKISISRALIDRWIDQGRSQDSRDTLMELSADLSVPARPGTINTPLRFWFFLFSCYKGASLCPVRPEVL